MSLPSHFNEFSIPVGGKGRYITTESSHPSEGSSSIFWFEFERSSEWTGLQGELIDNCILPLCGSYLRRRIREDYHNKIEFMRKNRGRYRHQIKLPDGSIA